MAFEPGVAVGDKVSPGSAIGTVPEAIQAQNYGAFNEPMPVEITGFGNGNLGVEEVIARYKSSKVLT